MNRLRTVALIMSLAAVGGASLEAAEITRTGDEAINAVRVVNNYGEMVRVYAEDAEGRLYKLGRVARGALVEFQIPAEIASESFRVRVLPDQPVWALHIDDYAVKTNPLHLDGDGDVTLWLEPDLSKSVVEVSRR